MYNTFYYLKFDRLQTSKNKSNFAIFLTSPIKKQCLYLQNDFSIAFIIKQKRQTVYVLLCNRQSILKIKQKSSIESKIFKGQYSLQVKKITKMCFKLIFCYANAQPHIFISIICSVSKSTCITHSQRKIRIKHQNKQIKHMHTKTCTCFVQSAFSRFRSD